MNTGTYISGGGHAVLVLGLLFGGWLGSEPPPPPDTAEVSIITEQEFAALSLPQENPLTQTDMPAPALPAADSALGPVPTAEEQPVTTEKPDAQPVPDPDVRPEVQDAPPPPDPDLVDQAPDLPAPDAPAPDLPVLAPPSDRAQPRPVPRVAPVPAEETPLPADIAETATPRVSPDANSTQQAEDLPAAAPEAAATEIVPEADKPAAAPTSSPRPGARPTRTAAADPAPKPADTAASDAIAAAVADAVAAAIPAAEPAPDPQPAAPAARSGPPLSRAEKDGLRVAVQQCWNLGTVSSDAMRVTVIVGVSMTPDAKPDANSIRMLDYFDGNDEAARQAFEAARRAIIRCGARGYQLPADKYDQWRDVEITFNPENMRSR